MTAVCISQGANNTKPCAEGHTAGILEMPQEGLFLSFIPINNLNNPLKCIDTSPLYEVVMVAEGKVNKHLCTQVEHDILQ